jgi:demethylmenaquinone methyltransferase / 2-methoxy-6-polyprenyl-1,4-benzoquinol methylase
LHFNRFEILIFIMTPQVVPYKDTPDSKKNQVQRMFDGIAHRYDFLNHFLSFGIDHSWRKRAIKKLSPFKPATILDVATGTGDFAIAAMSLHPTSVIGVDISQEMLNIGIEKVKHAKLTSKINFALADAESLPFPDHSFDAATCAFGVRNFENPLKGLTEIHRILKPGGKLVIIEFSNPARFPFKQFYRLYFNSLLPLMGKWISKDKSAYSYLPESVSYFPQGEKFMEILKNAGFSNSSASLLSFGIVSLYFAER